MAIEENLEIKPSLDLCFREVIDEQKPEISNDKCFPVDEIKIEPIEYFEDEYPLDLPIKTENDNEETNSSFSTQISNEIKVKVLIFLPFISF